MINQQKSLIIFVLLLVVGGASITTALATEPTIGTITLNPQTPARLSNVTFSVDVTGDSATSVHLKYKECDPGLCKVNRNVTMEKTTGDTYETTVTLTYEKATYITYHLEVNSSGTWTFTNPITVNLTNGTNGNGNHTGDGSDGKKSPGFELVPLIATIGLCVILLRRKRSR